MKKINQTEAVKVALYESTMMFTRQLQGHYYKQFCGDVDDLAVDFYMEFLEEKGNERKTLLDRYDREEVDGYSAKHWNAYIRTAVMRALIDESRTHPWVTVSFDAMLDECGDNARMSEALEDSPSVDELDYEEMKSSMQSRVRSMTPQQFSAIKSKYEGIKNVLIPECAKVLREVMNPRVQVMTTAGMLPVYKISNDSVYTVYKGKFEEFSKITGKPKHSIGVEFTAKGLAYVGMYKRFDADEKRKDFLKEICG